MTWGQFVKMVEALGVQPEHHIIGIAWNGESKVWAHGSVSKDGRGRVDYSDTSWEIVNMSPQIARALRNDQRRMKR